MSKGQNVQLKLVSGSFSPSESLKDEKKQTLTAATHKSVNNFASSLNHGRGIWNIVQPLNDWNQEYIYVQIFLFRTGWLCLFPKKIVILIRHRVCKQQNFHYFLCASLLKERKTDFPKSIPMPRQTDVVFLFSRKKNGLQLVLISIRLNCLKQIKINCRWFLFNFRADSLRTILTNIANNVLKP